VGWVDPRVELGWAGSLMADRRDNASRTVCVQLCEFLQANSFCKFGASFNRWPVVVRCMGSLVGYGLGWAGMMKIDPRTTVVVSFVGDVVVTDGTVAYRRVTRHDVQHQSVTDQTLQGGKVKRSRVRYRKREREEVW